jgi:peptidoglycan/LPS O-acetylase OafA/YrhL
MARLVALLGITLVPLCLRIAAYHRNPAIELFDGFYYRTHNRIDELLFGVVVAYLLVAYPDALRRFTERSGALLGLLALACFAAVWMVGGLQHGGAFSIIWQFWFAALGTSLLVLNVLFLKNGVTRFFAHHAWYPLARVSYGVFLIHPFVLFGLLSLMGKRMRDITMGDFALVTVSTHVIATLLAVLMFSLLERPLRDVGARVASRQR